MADLADAYMNLLLRRRDAGDVGGGDGPDGPAIAGGPATAATDGAAAPPEPDAVAGTAAQCASGDVAFMGDFFRRGSVPEAMGRKAAKRQNSVVAEGSSGAAPKKQSGKGKGRKRK